MIFLFKYNKEIHWELAHPTEIEMIQPREKIYLKRQKKQILFRTMLYMEYCYKDSHYLVYITVEDCGSL